MTDIEKRILKFKGKKQAKQLAKELGIKWRMVYYKRAQLRKSIPTAGAMANLKKHKKITFEALRKRGVKAEDFLSDLKKKGINYEVSGEGIQLKDPQPGGFHKIDFNGFNNEWIRFGVVSDTHLNSKYERLDALNTMYDIFANEGIKTVLHAGNLIDGYSRLNQFDVFNRGVNEQIQYAVRYYPQRTGIITHFITADDHEGWFTQREHVDIGQLIEDAAFHLGRKDLHHLGYMEANIDVKVGKRPTHIRVIHPSGGTAYAMSYRPQKIIESLTGGEKPDFLIIGHYHKAESGRVRNVPYVQAGCFEDQTPFMRKKSLRAHVGGWIIELHISPDGYVNRVREEFVSFFNKDFYKKPVETSRPYRQWTYQW